MFSKCQPGSNATLAVAPLRFALWVPHHRAEVTRHLRADVLSLNIIQVGGQVASNLTAISLMPVAAAGRGLRGDLNSGTAGAWFGRHQDKGRLRGALRLRQSCKHGVCNGGDNPLQLSGNSPCQHARQGGRAVFPRAERSDANTVHRGARNRRQAEFLRRRSVAIRDDRSIDIPVHAGFDAVAEAIYVDLKPYLKPDYKTYLTGHSLGGAIAALLAVYLMEDGHNVVRVVTFGQPRFTTAVGVERLSLPILRVVDENDMVPMLPPATSRHPTYGPYEHVGPEVILLEGPRYVYLPSHDANRIAIWELWRSTAFADLPDHKMDKYLLRLSTKRKGAVVVAYDDRERYVAGQSQD